MDKDIMEKMIKMTKNDKMTENDKMTKKFSKKKLS